MLYKTQAFLGMHFISPILKHAKRNKIWGPQSTGVMATFRNLKWRYKSKGIVKQQYGKQPNTQRFKFDWHRATDTHSGTLGRLGFCHNKK